MKLLILGANGQLGTDLIRVFDVRKAEWSIKTLSRPSLDVEEVDSIRGILENEDFDVLLNCTSFHKTDDVEANPAKAFRINAHAVRCMSQVCGERGARFIHFSTDYVFDGLAECRPYLEEAATGPLNVYGSSKLMGESLARSHCNDLMICRVASLFGMAGSSGKGGNFVETMIRVGKERGELKVVDDIIMSPTCTYDVACAVCELLHHRAPMGTYHVVNSGQASWYVFAKTIIERAGIRAQVHPVPADEFPTVAERPQFSALSNGKLKDAVGPMRHWHDALDQYLKEKGHMCQSQEISSRA